MFAKLSTVLFEQEEAAERVSYIKRWFKKIPFYYEPDIPADYTETGCERGAKYSHEIIRNDDVKRIFDSTRHLNLADTMAWVERHLKEFSKSTVIIDTDDGNSLRSYHALNPEVFIEKRALNKIRHLNTLLNRANEALEDGGYIWCHCRTAIFKKKVILQRFPMGINWIVYLIHYAWHRVCAKMPGLRKVYFSITKGKNRTYNRVEILGRMYRAGFEVMDEEFRQGEFFVLARKVRRPIWEDAPTGSPIIKLRRVGKDGNLIGVYKFRTMYSYSEYLQPYIFEHNHLQEGGKFADDYRVNVWGKIFRKLWIDELPMILNVLKGDIKLVGVRPLSRHYYSLYDEETQKIRIKAKPGLLPPFYAEKDTPKTLEEIQASERRYTEAYLRQPWRTDCLYLGRIFTNIVFKAKRSK